MKRLSFRRANLPPRLLHFFVVVLAFMFLGVSHEYPPQARAQTADQLERHIENTDRNVTQNSDAILRNLSSVTDLSKMVNSDHLDLAVLEGNIGLLKWIAGGIMVLAAANLAITVKAKKS